MIILKGYHYIYLEDENYLTDLYLNLLTRAIDKDRVNEAHPAFFHIIEQLSPDEAYFCFGYEKQGYLFRVIKIMMLKKTGFQISIEQRKNYLLRNLSSREMYYSHLESLNLVKWSAIKTEYPRDEKGVQVGLLNTVFYS